jgi:hypothetical protein
MNFLRSVSKSAHRCLESIQFTVIRASIERETIGSNFWGVSRNDNMHRMRTMARLHDSLFRIQMEIAEYQTKYDDLRKQAENSFRQKASEAQQKDDFNKMRLVELQKKALSKSENILVFTLNGLEKKGYIQNINKIIQYTVKQHKMVQEEGLIDDSQHESLVDAFDHITSNVAKGHDILETLDAQSWNTENEQDTQEGSIENETAFSKWKNLMMLEASVDENSGGTATTASAPISVNHLHVDADSEPTPSAQPAYLLQHKIQAVQPTSQDQLSAPNPPVKSSNTMQMATGSYGQ